MSADTAKLIAQARFHGVGMLPTKTRQLILALAEALETTEAHRDALAALLKPPEERG